MHDCLNEDLEVLVAKETEQPPKVNTPHGYYYLCYCVIMQIVSIPKRRATSVSTLAIAEDSRTQGVSGGDTDITVEQMVACYVETYKDELPLISKVLSVSENTVEVEWYDKPKLLGSCF